MKILIHPFSHRLPNGNRNAKNYPFWSELLADVISLGHEVEQIGIEGEQQLVPVFHKNLSLDGIREKLMWCDLYVAVDSFLPHLAHLIGVRGIVIWGKSDPLI